MTLRIGSVPYLNTKPLVDWFHSSDCNVDVEVIYDVPSRLALMLRSGDVDVTNCSIFESLRQPGLSILPGVSISSNGPVMSVRLFCDRPPEELRQVALDTSSLSSAALTRIILADLYHVSPVFVNAAPNLEQMLSNSDAGLIIGDLKLFELHESTSVLDLGECWKRLTDLPFVYAAWQCRKETATPELCELLVRAKDWGIARIAQLAAHWSYKLDLPVERCVEYFTHAMDYRLTDLHRSGLQEYRDRCVSHGLIANFDPLPFYDPT